MSINLGDQVSNPVTATPALVTLTLTPASASITATSNNASNVTASQPTLTLTALNHQINEDVTVQPNAGSLALAALTPAVVFTPVQGDVTVDASRPQLTLSANSHSINATFDEVNAFQNDYETPEQISLYASITGTLSEDVTATVEYRLQGAQSWVDAAPLWRIEPEYAASGPPQTVLDAFSGCIFDLSPGNTYDVRVTISDGVQSEQRNDTFTTRALPTEAGTATTTLSSPSESALASAINGASPGDVIEFSGTVNMGSPLVITANGTPAQPIYIRGTNQASAILNRTTAGGVITINSTGGHLLFENFTISGAGTDGGTSSSTYAFGGTDANAITNITARRLIIEGVDRCVVAGGASGGDWRGLLFYDNDCDGNNQWTAAYTETNTGWNDDGVRFQGQGNCVWNNDFSGFGDTLAFNDGTYTAACFGYRNLIEYSVDDAIEAEYMTRNCGFYDNYLRNVTSGFSVDGLYGGPLYVFRNRWINIGRNLIKCGDSATGFRFYNNTFVKDEGIMSSPAGTRGWYWSQNANPRDWEYKNNLLLWEGSGEVLRFDDALSALQPNVVQYNGWGRNAQDINWAGTGGASGSVLTVNAALTPIHDNDFELTNQAAVFETPVTFGVNYLSAITTDYDLALSVTSEAIGNGEDIPNISGGTDVGARQYNQSAANYGNRYTPNTAPSWVTSLTLNQWTATSATNTLQDVGYFGTSNPDYTQLRSLANIFKAWNGGAYAPIYGASGSMIHYGGGHTDYYGNEIYAFDMATRTWSRVTDPSPFCPTITGSGEQIPGGIFPDGTPGVPHTSHNLTVRPGTNTFICTRREFNNIGSGSYVAMAYCDLDTGTWTCPTDRPSMTSSVGSVSVYDTTRDMPWHIEGRGGNLFDMAGFDWDTSTWSKYDIDNGAYQTGPAAYVPTKDVIVVFYNGSTVPRIIFPGSPTTNSVAMTTSGSAPTYNNIWGADWSDSLGAIVIKQSSTASTPQTNLWTLTPPAGDYTGTWTWASISESGSIATPASNYVGDYSKFRVIDYDDAVVGVLCQDWAQDYYAIRLA